MKLGYEDGRITCPVEHGNRGEPESELVMVEKSEWDRLRSESCRNICSDREA